MKKLLSTILFISITLFANAYDFMVDGLCYNINIDGSSVTLTYQYYSQLNYSDLSGDIVIPENVTYNGITYSVTSIGESAFEYCSGLTTVTIPNSVTLIGGSAFSGCISLTTVTVPNSVTEIDGWAFYNCTGLTSVIIGNSVTSIGKHTFYNCTGLISVTIPNSVTKIGDNAFENCTSLISVTFPNSITSIGSEAFYGCRSLTSVTVPNSVTSIGSSAFYGCIGLNTAIIGENVTSIGSGAFKNCSFMENLVAMRERPIIISSNVFDGVPKASCDLHVREGSKIRYENQDVWKDFLIIVEDAEDWADVGGGGSSTGVYGDVNGDGQVTAADVTAVYDVLLGNQ